MSPQGIVFSISERSEVTCIFSEFTQRWLWLISCGFWKWFWASTTCIYYFLRRPRASVGKAPSSIFDWALVRMVCLLEGLQEWFFEQKPHYKSVQKQSSTTTVEAHSYKHAHITFDLTEIKDDASTD